jgi:hypothetical protein
MMVKHLNREGFISQSFGKRQKDYWAKMPGKVKRALSPESVVLDSHIITEAFERPNYLHSDYHTMYSMAASLMTAGRSVLMWDTDNPTAGISGIESPGVYYLPMHWLEPKGDPAIDGWTVTPPHTGNQFDLLPGEFIYTMMPDPEDPHSALSPMKAQARTINASDKIHDVHYHSLENLMRPSYAVVTGRLPGTDGQAKGPRIKLGKDDRAKLKAAIKREVSGAGRRGDPVILDAMIEDIRDLGSKPTDLDYSGGSSLTENRIMQGFGTSPIVAGWAQSANRAGSIVAHEVFYDLVLNPLIVLCSRSLTHTLGPQYSTEDYVVTVYIEEAQVKDPDAVRGRVALFRDRLSDSEIRRYLRTGELEIEDDDMTFREEQAARTPTRPGE